MPLALTRLTAQGQISVPSEIRKKLGVGPGSVLEWDENDDQIHKELTLQDADVVALALDDFRSRPSLGFSDCLVLEIARKAGHVPLGTFDRNIAKLDCTHRL